MMIRYKVLTVVRKSSLLIVLQPCLRYFRPSSSRYLPTMSSISYRPEQKILVFHFIAIIIRRCESSTESVEKQILM